MMRCNWCNKNNPLYVTYHDAEWGVPRFDDAYLFEMLVLESFQAGLSWECILNKRENFRRAFDGFDPQKIQQYDDEKIETLLQDAGIVRNRRKILATVKNAAVFQNIVTEHGSFIDYLKVFWNGIPCVETGMTHSKLSDMISHDLQRRGMKFVGTTIIYAYLQAIGVINSHEPGCFLYEAESSRPLSSDAK